MRIVSLQGLMEFIGTLGGEEFETHCWVGGINPSNEEVAWSGHLKVEIKVTEWQMGIQRKD